MEYIITGIKDCHFVFNHNPAVPKGHFGPGSPEKYEGEIELELVMYQELRITPARKVTKTLISFLYTTPTNVVIVETKELVSIQVPINFDNGFYKMLCESLYDKKYRLTLLTAGEVDMTVANFHFLPR